MALPWRVVACAASDEGALELRQQGEAFLITVDGRVLMNSRASLSELALGELAAAAVGGRPAPRVLLGGLGMGLTLRALLQRLPADAELVVAELNAAVVDWCAGPLAEVCGAALADPRVAVVVADVAREIAAGAGCFDAIVLDLYDGPSRREDEPFFGRRALRLARQALRAGGVLAVWGEEPCPSFERRLAAEGFTAVEHQRHGRGGRKHSVYTATAGERARRRSPGKGKRG